MNMLNTNNTFLGSFLLAFVRIVTSPNTNTAIHYLQTKYSVILDCFIV